MHVPRNKGMTDHSLYYSPPFFTVCSGIDTDDKASVLDTFSVQWHKGWTMMYVYVDEFLLPLSYDLHCNNSWAGLLPLLTFNKQSGQQHSESQQNQLLHVSWQQHLKPTQCLFQHGARADIKCHLDCLSLLVNELRLRIGPSWCTTLAREEKGWWRSQDKTLVIMGGPLWY